MEEGVKANKFERLSEFLRFRKYYILAIAIILIAIGVGSYFIFVGQEKTSVKYKATIAVIEGTVKKGDRAESLVTAEARETLAKNQIISTSDSSSAVIYFPSDDLLILGANTLVKIHDITALTVSLELIEGETYSIVEKKEGKNYKFVKGITEVVALGTEYMVTAPKGSTETFVYVFKSSVELRSKGNIKKIEEGNKATFNSATSIVSMIGTFVEKERDLNKPYLALYEKSKAQVAIVQETSNAAVQEQAAADNPLSTASNSTSKKTTANSATNGSTGPRSTSQNSAGSNTANSSATEQSDGSASATANSTGTNGSSPNTTPTIPTTPVNPPSSPTIYGNLDGTSIESIVNSLQLVYNDPLGDWVTPPGGADPVHGVYDYDPADIDSLFMGIHGGRLYLKVTAGGTFPTTRQTIDDNTINSITFNFGLDSDGDLMEACSTEVSFQVNMGYESNGNKGYFVGYNANCTGGESGTHSAVFEKSGHGLAHTYNSGFGKNSIVISYALSDLADLVHIGDNLNVYIASEVSSNLWEHYSFDLDTLSNEPVWAAWTAAEI